MPSDLHMHTNFSDGKLSPEELVAAAKAAGLKYISISDHDTVDGIVHLYEAGLYPNRGIRIIPGVEFSAHHPEREIHILGYNVDIFHQGLLEKLNDVMEARWSRFSEIVEKLRVQGCAVREADVLKIAGSSKSISRSHIARALVKNKCFSTIREAFEKLLEKGRPAYVPHYRLEVEEIIDLVREAGGVSVLAHPKLVKDDALVEEVLSRGIQGIEVFYPRHDEEDVKRYMAMAEKYNLLVTGGSDFHGFPTRWPDELGVFTIDDSWAEKLYRPKQN